MANKLSTKEVSACLCLWTSAVWLWKVCITGSIAQEGRAEHCLQSLQNQPSTMTRILRVKGKHNQYMKILNYLCFRCIFQEWDVSPASPTYKNQVVKFRDACPRISLLEYKAVFQEQRECERKTTKNEEYTWLLESCIYIQRCGNA